MESDSNVSRFYNEGRAWDPNPNAPDNATYDASLFEDLRPISRAYLSRVRLKVNRYITNITGDAILDFASGPIQYDEYLSYSSGFRKRFCVDFSSSALNVARSRIGDSGEFFVGDYFDISFPENFFDCSLCIHTLYHIHKDKQLDCVNKLISETKSGGNVVILYSNPRSLNRLLRSVLAFFGWKSGKKQLDLYFYAHPLSWWTEHFSENCTVRLKTWRLFEASVMKLLVRENFLGGLFLRLFSFVESLDSPVVRGFADYPMVILTKK